MARILVVDDAQAVKAMCAEALAGAGYEVWAVETAAHALHELDGWKPDGIVLDFFLGDGDPAGVARLRAALRERHLPVLLVSGLDDDVAPAVARGHGWAYMPKPLEEGPLLRAVEELLTGDDGPDEPSRSTMLPDLPEAPRPSDPRAAPRRPSTPRAVEPPDEPTPEPVVLPAPPAVPSNGPLHPDPLTARTDMVSRRWLRALAIVVLGILALYGMIHRIPLDGALVAAFSILGAGPDAIAAAARARPAATVAGGAALLTLGIVGDATDVHAFGTVATAGAAVATGLVDWARGA